MRLERLLQLRKLSRPLQCTYDGAPIWPDGPNLRTYPNFLLAYDVSAMGLYSYFSHSCVHTKKLASVQQVLEEPVIKMKPLYQVRWLSFDNAVDAVLQITLIFNDIFEHPAEEGDPHAIGIHHCITTYKFLALTYLMKDVLSVLTKT